MFKTDDYMKVGLRTTFMQYDVRLNLELPEGGHIIGYDDDVALVISHTLPQALKIIANDSLSRCDSWLNERRKKQILPKL
ncbi:hypothetical protein FF38_07592 [Lucilia cuprina]|uniref:Uncharacterized protein n=1 Tax=Lucilia cuprina TaxID=7375 RepID=A0A0L0BZH5_LUCCU|nr:hypothetical protein FF38_07592 [Lucilia cuprina]